MTADRRSRPAGPLSLKAWLAAAALGAAPALVPAAFGQQTAATVTTADDTDDAGDGETSFREALAATVAGGHGVRFDVPAFADPGVAPLVTVTGAVPAGRAGVRVDLGAAAGGNVELLIRPGAGGAHRLDPTFTGVGTITADLGGGAADELTLAGHNAHGLTKVLSGTVVAATPTGFGRHLDLAAGGGGRISGTTYLSRLTGEGTLNLGSETLVLGVFPLNPGSDSAAADGPGSSSAFAGTITGSATGGLVKAGTGTVTLTGTNTYGGGTSILGGRLEVRSAAALGTGDLQIANGGHLRLLGELDDRPGHAAGPAFLRQIALGGVGGSVDLNGHDLLLGGRVSGPGGLTVFGGAALTLGQDNTYAGGTAVDGATLVLGTAGALGTGDLYLNQAALRTAHTAGQVTYGRQILLGEDGGTVETSGGDWAVVGGIHGGPLTKTGDGELRLLSPGTLTAATVTGGSLAVTGLSALGSGLLTLDGGALFTELAEDQDDVLGNAVALGTDGGTIRTEDSLTLAGVITGDGALTKTGAGTLTLAGRNEATGGAVVSAGALRADNAAALGAGPLTLDGGTFATAGGLRLGDTAASAGVSTTAAGGGLRHTRSGARTVLAGDWDLDGNLSLAGGGTYEFAPDTLATAAGVAVAARGGVTVDVSTAAPALRMAAGTRLTGGGRVLGDVTTAGVLAPGAGGPGVLTVDGDLTLQAGSEVVADFTASGVDGLSVGGAADLSGATLTLNVSGTDEERRAMAAAVSAPGSTSSFTFLGAHDGVTAGFGAVRTNSWSLAATSTVERPLGASGQPVSVTLSRVANGAAAFADAGDAAMADALFGLMPAATGDAADLFAAAVLTDAAGARPLFAGLAGASTGGLGGVSRAGASAVRRTTFRALRGGGAAGGLFRGQDPGGNATGSGDDFGFGDFDLPTEIPVVTDDVRTADVGGGGSDAGGGVEGAAFTSGSRAARPTRGRGGRDLPWGGFAEGYVVGGEVGVGPSETEYLTAGAVFGVDRLVAAGTRVGVLAGVGGTGADSGGAADRFDADVSSWQLGVYGTHARGRLHTAASAVYGGDRYDFTRTVNAGGRAFAAGGDTTGSTVTLAAELGYLLPVDFLDLQPLAGLQYVYSSRDAYAETGLGAANLAYGEADGSSLRVQLGGRASKLLGEAGRFAVVPEVRAWWFGEVAGEDSPAPVRFAAAPTLPAFTTVGDDPANQWVLGAGLTTLLGRHVRLYAHYDLLLGEDALSHAGTGGAELRW